MRTDRPNHSGHTCKITRRIFNSKNAIKLCQSADCFIIDWASKERNIVQRYIYRTVDRYFSKICKDTFWWKLVVERGNNSDCPGTEVMVRTTRIEGLANIRLGCTGKNRNPVGRLVADNLYDSASLFCSKASELTSWAIWIKSMHSFIDQPINVTTQFFLINVSIWRKRNH